MVDFQQEDTSGGLCAAAQYCASQSLHGSPAVRRAIVGGTPGSTEVSYTYPNNEADTLAMFFHCVLDSDLIGNGGTWTINLDVTSGDAQIDWESITICRLNSSCVNQEEIGSVGSLGTTLNPPATFTNMVTGNAVDLEADDVAMVELGFTNTQNMTNSFGITPSLLIQSPFAAPAAGGGGPPTVDGFTIAPLEKPLWRRKPKPFRIPTLACPRAVA